MEEILTDFFFDEGSKLESLQHFWEKDEISVNQLLFQGGLYKNIFKLNNLNIYFEYHGDHSFETTFGLLLAINI